jgi:hypothetical protein
VDSGVFQPQLNESLIYRGDDAAREVASDFRASPVADRAHADQVVVIGLTECFPHKISVQAGLNDRVSAPIGKVRDENIHA